MAYAGQALPESGCKAFGFGHRFFGERDCFLRVFGAGAVDIVKLVGKLIVVKLASASSGAQAEFCGGALRERSSVDGLPVGDFRFRAAIHSVGNYIDVWAGSHVEAKPGALGMEGQIDGAEWKRETGCFGGVIARPIGAFECFHEA